MTTTDKTAAKLLIDYGYSEVSPGLFVPARPSSERWEATEGGFFCYAPATRGITGGDPWGIEVSAGLMRVPYRQSTEERWRIASGLHPALVPEAFEWVWPEARLVEIYAHAPKDGGPNPWRKVDGEYIEEG